MKRIALLVGVAPVFIGGFAIGQSQGWQADQDGSQFKLYDVHSVEIDSSLTTPNVCLETPTSILYTPLSPATDVKISLAQQNGTGGMTVSCDNVAGFLVVGADANKATFTAPQLDTGGVSFQGDHYFGLRTDAGTYLGNMTTQQFWSALQSEYEASGTVNLIPLNGTLPLDTYYWRGESVGIDGTSGVNIRPDGISWFTFDSPSLVTQHGFSATGYETVEIRGLPCSGPTCYGLRIYGGSSDLSERVSGFYVSDAAAGAGTQCAAFDNTGKLIGTGSACGSGSGTVTSVTGTAGRIVVTPPTPNPVVDLAAFGTASTCAWANVVTDAWGRTTCTANTAPQPAGSYITSLTHDAIASGPGAASTEVVGVTDGTSVDHPVAASAWTNGQALALDGLGDIHTIAFQAPLVACTDYVSLSCQAGTSDIANTNGDVHVDAIHESGGLRIPVGACTTDGQAFVKVAGQMTCRLPSADLSNDYTAPWVTAIHESSGPTQLAIAGIPDTAPFLDVMGRDGVHGNTVIGVSSPFLTVSDRLQYFMDVTAIPVTTGWIGTSNSGTFYNGIPIEYVMTHEVTKIIISYNLITNGIVTGGPTIGVTRNGTGLTGCAFSFGSSTPTGPFTFTCSSGSSSASDTYGLQWATSSTGSLRFTTSLVFE